MLEEVVGLLSGAYAESLPRWTTALNYHCPPAAARSLGDFRDASPAGASGRPPPHLTQDCEQSPLESPVARGNGSGG